MSEGVCVVCAAPCSGTVCANCPTAPRPEISSDESDDDVRDRTRARQARAREKARDAASREAARWFRDDDFADGDDGGDAFF